MIYHQFRWSPEQCFLLFPLFQRMVLAISLSYLILVSWLLPHSHSPLQNTKPFCRLNISWKHPFLSIFPTILVWTTMISQGFGNALPFSSLDPFRSIVLVRVGMFLKYKPDHGVLSTPQFWALSMSCRWLNQYSGLSVSWPSHPLMFPPLQLSYAFSPLLQF